MVLIAPILALLEQWAPPGLAESWDNTGLLLGDPHLAVERVMTCLTVTPAVVAEAIERRVSLLIPHHPLPFRPLTKITSENYYGRLLWPLANHQIAIASLHTRYDSAAEGINQQLAERLGLSEIQPLVEAGTLGPAVARAAAGGEQPAWAATTSAAPKVGRGRWGRFATPPTLEQLAATLKASLGIGHLQHVPCGKTRLNSVAIGCGSAGEFLTDAIRLHCDLLILGETTFHTCLEAQGHGVELLLVGHYASERFALESLAQRLAAHFPDLQVWCSQAESDPVHWI